MSNTIIRNVRIYDGSGSPPSEGCIYIQDGHFSAPFSSSDATVIDGLGLSACPGFIDAHTHSDFCLGSEFNSLSRVSQGITSQIAGQCGKSAVLRDAEMYNELDGDLTPLKNPGYDDPELFRTFQGYKNYVDHLPMVENTAFLVGHGNIRRLVMGFSDRVPTELELEQMKQILREALEHGAIGMSSGLFYPPGVYASEEELIELCKIVAEYDGIYTTHLRSEGADILPALNEALRVARLSGCRLNISHLKTGRNQPVSAEDLLQRIRAAREDGLSVAVDQYPYSAGCTGMEIIIPPRHFNEGYDALTARLKDEPFRDQLKEEITAPDSDFENVWRDCGGFENILVGDCPNTPEAIGKTIAQIAAERGTDDFTAYFDLLVENNGNVLGIYFDISEEAMLEILCDPSIMVGCDSAAPLPGSSGHPRTFGTCTRILGHFCRDQNILPIETAIFKMTGLPADVFHLSGKGLITPGMDADLVLFDENTVADTADYTSPEKLSSGIVQVFVGGEIVYQNSQLTPARPGRGLYANRQGV